MLYNDDPEEMLKVLNVFQISPLLYLDANFTPSVHYLSWFNIVKIGSLDVVGYLASCF